MAGFVVANSPLLQAADSKAQSPVGAVPFPHCSCFPTPFFSLSSLCQPKRRTPIPTRMSSLGTRVALGWVRAALRAEIHRGLVPSSGCSLLPAQGAGPQGLWASVLGCHNHKMKLFCFPLALPTPLCGAMRGGRSVGLPQARPCLQEPGLGGG